MIQLNWFSVNLYIFCSIQLVLSNQDGLSVQPEDKLQSFHEDADYLLNSINKNTKQDLTNELMNAFDSSIYYNINWNKRPDEFELNDSIVTVTTKDSNRYHCLLPKIESHDTPENAEADIDPYSKIEHLFKKKICIYKLDSYWTYEVCLNDYIRQFNGDILEKKHTQEYFLGHFKASNLENDRKEYRKRVEDLKSRNKQVPKIDYEGVKVPFIYLTMDKGTTCDLTNQPRSTKVYFVCDKNEKPQLETIEEVQSCEYEAIISTNLLCDHPDFKEKKENELQINCYPNNNDQPIKPYGLQQFETKPLELYSDTIFQQIQEIFGDSKFKFELKEALPKGNTKIKAVDRTKFIDSVSKEMSIESFINAKNCYISTFKQYWKYSFCFKKAIKMFHEEAGIKTQTISLGKFNEDKHLDWLDRNPEKRKSPTEVNYLFSDGDICHETNRLRYVEVKLRCPQFDSKHFSMTLEEPRLCEYILTLESELMCKLLQMVDENGI